MTDRVLDISERPASLSVRNSQLSIRFERDEPVTIPLTDIAVVIVSHPQVSYTHAVLSGLALAGALFVTCDEKHLPVSMLLPLVTHSLQTERFAAQAALALPVRKRIWQQIARAKITIAGQSPQGKNRGRERPRRPCLTSPLRRSSQSRGARRARLLAKSLWSRSNSAGTANRMA